MAVTLHRPAVARGAIEAAVVALPAALATAALDRPEESSWVFVLVLVVLAAMARGGYAAARLAPDAPLAHGSAAAAVAYVPFVAIDATARLLDRADTALGTAVVRWMANGLLFVSVAALGALVASWREARTAREGTSQ